MEVDFIQTLSCQMWPLTYEKIERTLRWTSIIRPSPCVLYVWLVRPAISNRTFASFDSFVRTRATIPISSKWGTLVMSHIWRVTGKIKQPFGCAAYDDVRSWTLYSYNLVLAHGFSPSTKQKTLSFSDISQMSNINPVNYFTNSRILPICFISQKFRWAKISTFFREELWVDFFLQSIPSIYHTTFLLHVNIPGPPP